MHIYITDPNGKTLCALSNDSSSLDSFIFYDSEFKQSLTTPSTFSFSCPMNHPNSKHITCNNQVIFKYDGKYHMFTIIEIEETHDNSHNVNCYCEAVSLELINSVVIPSTNQSQTARQALGIVLSDVDWKIGEVGDFGSKDIELTGYKTTLEEIQNLAELYEAEVRYRIEYDGNNGVKGKYIDFVERVSDAECIRFEYGVNTTDVIRKVDASNVCTAVIPIGNDDIDIGDIECTADQYRQFTKPKGQLWVGLDESERTSITNSPYHIFVSVNYETDDKFELAEKAWKHLQENKTPKVEYTFNPTIINQKYEIGAKAYCIDRMMNLSLEAEISEITICFEDSSKNSITLTNHVIKESNIDWSLINTIKSQLKDIEIEPEIVVSDTLPPVTEGKPIIWVDTSEAVESTNNDGLVVLKPFDGQQWQDVLTSTVVDNKIDIKVEENNTVIKQEIKQEAFEEAEGLVTEYVDAHTETKISKGNTEPSNPVAYQLWIDTSTSPNRWKMWTGSSWTVVLTSGVDSTVRNDLNSTKNEMLQELANLQGEDSRIYQELVNTNEVVSSKLGRVEVEGIVNDAVASLSGDGQNLLLYGACDDIPRIADTNFYRTNHAIITVVDGMVKLQPDGTWEWGAYYHLGDNTLTNGFLNDTYTLAFDIRFPSGSSATNSNVHVKWNDGSDGNDSYLKDLQVVSTSGEFTRYSTTYTFTGNSSNRRYVEFYIYSPSTEAIILLDNIKLERGEEATAFTKNPNELTAAELTNLKVRITQTESALEQTNDRFSSYVMKTTYNTDKATVEESISQMTSRIQQNADSISLKVSATELADAIDNIELGGRNYLLISGSERQVNSTGYLMYTLSSSAIEALQGKDITISFDAKKEDTLTYNMYAYFRSSSALIKPASRKIGDVTSEYKRYTITFTAPSDLSSALTFCIHTSTANAICLIKNAKLELGNKASDWTVAPEETDQKLSTMQTSIDQKADSLTLSATQAELQGNINAIQVGGTNLVLNSKELVCSNCTQTTDNDGFTINSKKGNRTEWLKDTIPWDYNALNNPLGGKEITVSFDVRCNATNANLLGNFYLGLGVFNSNTQEQLVDYNVAIYNKMYKVGTIEKFESHYVANEWMRVYYTYTIPSDWHFNVDSYYACQFKVDTTPSSDIVVDMRKLKVEIGNKPTEWSPSPTDISLRVESAEASIKINSDNISQTVRKDGVISSINQSPESVTINANKLNLVGNTAITTLQTNIDNIKVGGRNYAIGTLSPYSKTGANKSNDTGTMYKVSDDLINDCDGKVLTMSYDYTVSGTSPSGSFYVQTAGGSVWHGFGTNTITSTGTFHRVSTTTFGSDYNGNFTHLGIHMDNVPTTCTVKIFNLKLEEGNKATDWTKAQEDIDIDIINGSVGGRNLIQYTDFKKWNGTGRASATNKSRWYAYGSSSLSFSTDGWAILKTDGDGKNSAISGRHIDNKYGMQQFKPSTWYTLSFKAYASQAVSLTYMYIMSAISGNYSMPRSTVFSNTYPELTTSVQDFSYTFKTPSSLTLRENIGILIGISGSTNTSAMDIYIKDIMLEEGTVKHNWQPAPEDGYALIEINENGISQKVSANGVISSINQSAEEIAINANKISLNNINVGDGQFVVDGDGKVTVGGKLNGASGTFTGTITQDGTYSDVEITSGYINVTSNVSDVNTKIYNYGTQVYSNGNTNLIHPLGFELGMLSETTQEYEYTADVTLNGNDGYMYLNPSLGLNVNGLVNVSNKVTATTFNAGLNKYWTNSDEGLNLNNSSIRNAHSLVFKTDCGLNNRGIFFLKTDKTAGSTSVSDYNKLAIIDGKLSIDGETVVTAGKYNNQLWTGCIYMQGSHTITPSKKLTDCANGWALVWGDFSNTEENKDQFSIQFVPKNAVYFSQNSSVLLNFTSNINSTPFHKRCYTNGTILTGVDANGATQTSGSSNYYQNSIAVLYAVLEV